MTVALTKVTPIDATKLLSQRLACVADERGLQIALAAEHIRGTLFANASRAIEAGTSSSVHTTRLLTSTRKALELVWTKSALAGLAGQSDGAQMALDADRNPVFLFPDEWSCNFFAQRNPEIRLSARPQETSAEPAWATA